MPDVRAVLMSNVSGPVRASTIVPLMNQNVYPAHREGVLAALPIQETRVLMNGSHTSFFDPEGDETVRAVSHKA